MSLFIVKQPFYYVEYPAYNNNNIHVQVTPLVTKEIAISSAKERSPDRPQHISNSATLSNPGV